MNTPNNYVTKKKKGGFTLIEVIAVLILLGILAAIALPRYIDMTNEARQRAIDAAVSELNGREALEWGREMLLDPAGTAADATVFANMDLNLGAEYTWVGVVAVGGGTLRFQGDTDSDTLLTRTPTPAPDEGPSVWTTP